MSKTVSGAPGAPALEADIALRDGSTVDVRPTRAADEPAILAFLGGLSEESRYFRFFSGAPNLRDAARRAATSDVQKRCNLVATVGTPSSIVAHAGYVRNDADRAEVAFAVADAFQGRGISTILLGQLAEIAQAVGITSFDASVLSENHRMIGVFRESGFAVSTRAQAGVIDLEFLSAPGGNRALCAAGAARGDGRTGACAGAQVGCRHRGIAHARHDRRGAFPQPARKRLQRPGLSRQSLRSRRPVGGGVSNGARY